MPIDEECGRERANTGYRDRDLNRTGFSFPPLLWTTTHDHPQLYMAANTKATETQILSSFLLSRASLQDIISLRQFTELFPKDQRSNPQVKLLYRELQLLRNKTCERVKKNIHHEAELGTKQRSDAERKRRALKDVDDDAMTGIDVRL